MEADYLVMNYEHSSEVTRQMSMIVFLPRSKSPTAVDDMLNGFTDETLFNILIDIEKTNPSTVDVEFPKMSEGATYSLDGVSISEYFRFKNILIKMKFHLMK